MRGEPKRPAKENRARCIRARSKQASVRSSEFYRVVTKRPGTLSPSENTPSVKGACHLIVLPVTCPVFVGRKVELTALLDARRTLAQSRGSVVLVGGEAGVGKSRLLAQFLGRVMRDSRPRFVASAECLERGDVPYGPFRRLLASIGLEFPGAPQHDRAEIFAAVTTTLREAASKRVTILTLEDLHWADQSSLELLAYLAPRVAGTRILFVATYRTEDVEISADFFASLSRLSRESTVARISLEAFDPNETRDLLEGAMRDRTSLPENVREDVVRRSEGNPFFAEELLKDALDRSTSGRTQLPISIRATIANRLGVLTPHERHVFANAAVLGYRFDPDLLAKTMETTLEDVLPVLLRGRDLNIVVEEEDDRGRFRFRHALTRQAVYEAMLMFDARRTHARILNLLESFRDDTRHIDALAYHAWEARDIERTVRYNEAAGRAAIELRALPEARACYERALGAAADPRLKADLLAQIGFIAEMQGSLVDAIDRFSQACTLYKELGAFDQATEMVRAIATNRNNIDDATAIDFGLNYLDEFGARASVGPRDALIALLARLASIQAKYDLAREILARIEEPENLIPRARQNYLITQMDQFYFFGDTDRWLALVPRLFETIDQLPPFVACTALYAIGQSATHIAASDIARRAYARADEIESRWEFGALRAFGATLRAQHAWFAGDLAAARQYMIAGSAGSEAAVARMALAVIAPHVAAAVGDESLVPSTMESDFETCRRTPEQTLDDGQILMAAAVYEFARGRPEAGRRDLRRSFALLERVLPWAGPLLVLAAEHFSPAECEKLKAMIAPDQFLPCDAVGRANADLAHAVLEQRFGDPVRAIELARSAAERYRSFGWPLYEAHALDIAGDTEQARAIYGRCGATALAGPRPKKTPAHPLLSEREFAIALMIAEGATNASIGESLTVGTKTVEKYVSAIFRKLGVERRAQIAARISRQD